MDSTHTNLALRVTDLGRMPYADAFDLQRRINQQVIDGETPPTLLLVEHEPVITVSHRKSAAGHLIADRNQLDRLGIEVEQTDRGGDITYHGPGQLVAYPILRMNDFGLNLARYMRTLEQVVIDAISPFGVRGFREEGATGVWIDPANPAHGKPSPLAAKLCALGVRVRKNVTMHGLALNVTTDLTHFQTIVPCGLAGRPVTSLAQVLGDAAPGMDTVKLRLVDTMRRTLQRRVAERRP